MPGKTNRRTRGFTLVELIVTLGIVALLAAIAIPGLARLGAFSRDEYRRTIQEVSGLLRSAQIYSSTYHVNAAVVYNMDNYSAAEVVSGTSDYATQAIPVIDSVAGVAVRQIESAAIMYELPQGGYVPVPDATGEFTPLPRGMVIMLANPETPDTSLLPAPVTELEEVFYFDATWSNFQPGVTPLVNCICAMGLNSVNANLPIANGVPFMAHVFRPSGRMSVAGECPTGDFATGDTQEPCGPERFSIYIAPSADRPPSERLVDPEDPDFYLDGDGSTNLMYRTIQVFKSTGRIEVPKNF